ncbi:4-hydroxybenzoate octaprenyltransferase [Parapedobacter pyrenivorans]|uniref:4-hydroxybenzoate polyprenyltransferase n=1 Tax=Parapedobacter pyrenivorans TaxID=1305674 RepID=A0A917MFV9_9SPHI|nr:UbiA-like polyprenyltransferase [Parapedobacter pyrenivorans]GGG98156.1 4-hydroxybenzoate octaprenyltransferase [Parapedobacter pyrenivorans]
MNKYFSLVLFVHSIFALPFAIIGFFLAVNTTAYGFDWVKLLLMLACMVFARNAAMAFNRYLDRHIDAVNPRTAMRDIPAGKVTPSQALAFTIINCILFVIATWFINLICFSLSPVALAVVLGYSYTKRFTPLCHLILGLGLGLAPLGAYMVVAGAFHIVPIFYALAVLFWVAGFDIIYALQDEEFDREHQLSSIPAWLGKRKALNVSEVLHVLSAIFVLLPVFFMPLGWFYVAGIVFYCALLIYQHRIVSPSDLSKVDRAFMTTNGLASVVFACFFLLDMVF